MCDTTDTTTTEVATTTNKKEIVLRPYQQECVDLINSTESGSHLIVLSTALGKTVIFSHIQRRGRVLILSHREELVHQPEKYYDCSFGVERAEETSHGEEVISASVQTLIHRLDKFSPDDFDTIITDECFPAGTLVDGVPIEQIQIGDWVTAYNHSTGELEHRKVTHVFRKPHPEKMVKINAYLECTPNHPIYEMNSHQYVRADSLVPGDMMLCVNPSNNSRYMEVNSVCIINYGDIAEQLPHSHPARYVYNLEVEGLNNYFANGVLVHNCHHSVAPSYRKIYDYFKPRLHLGFTATPNRADKTGLSEIFDDILFERNLKWGIKNGYLSPIECRRIDVGYDLEGIHTRLGDFAQNELENAIDITTCNEAVAKVYEDYSSGPTIIFAASVSHAENIAELIPGAEVITATTTNRSEILNRFTSGELRCIVNCMVLTEGTDLPNVETIIMARPTKNVSLYTQMAGRGLRLSPSTGKEKLNLIDCVGVSSMNICAAPSLFGINPMTAIENNQAEGDLMTMESRIEEEQNRRQLNKDFWKINETLINLFTEDGEKYSTHNVNYLVMANGDLVCSVGDYKSIRITAEDMVGNCHMVMIDTNTSTTYMDRRKVLRKNIPVQEALDYAYQILTRDFAKKKSIWDLDSMKKWMNQPASLKQVNFINTLYSPAALLRLGVDMVNLNKYQASVLIGRKMARK